MIRLSDSIERIEPSPTMAAAARAKKLKAEGRDIISFSVGEPDFDTPRHIKAAAEEALAAGYTKYPPVAGIPELRTAISNKFKRLQGLDYEPGQVVVCNGGKHALAAACAVVLNPGDEAVIPSPYWTSYPDMVELAGGNPVIVDTSPGDGYLMSPKALDGALTERTKIVILNSPSNPTGACYSEDDLKALGEVIISSDNASDLLVISDEVYEHIIYDGRKHVSFASAVPSLRDNTLIVNAFSKAYAMTGWRVGYAAGPKPLVDAMVKHQSQFTSGVCSIAQHAATVAYDDDCAFPKKMCERFSERRRIVESAIGEIGGLNLCNKPAGAFYAFVELDGLMGGRCGAGTLRTAADFSRYLLEKFDTVVVPGEAFGRASAFRLSFALGDDDLKRGLDRISEACASIRN